MILDEIADLGGTVSGAEFDDRRIYRYRLWRIWDPALPRLGLVLLNPSTADALKDDATIRRCLGFARLWRFGSLEVANLYAFKSTDPAELYEATDPVGPDNDARIRGVSGRAAELLVGWGAHPLAPARVAIVLALGRPLMCLGTTKDGQPLHPLRLRSDTPRRAWTPLSVTP